VPYSTVASVCNIVFACVYIVLSKSKMLELLICNFADKSIFDTTSGRYTFAHNSQTSTYAMIFSSIQLLRRL